MNKKEKQKRQRDMAAQRRRERARPSMVQVAQDAKKLNHDSAPQPKLEDAEQQEVWLGDSPRGFRLIIEICAALAIACAAAITIIIAYHVASLLIPVLTFVLSASLGFPFYQRYPCKISRRAIIASFALVAVGCSYWEYRLLRPVPVKTEFAGVLTPANDPTPPDPCDKPGRTIPKDALRLYFGDSVAWTMCNSPYPVLRFAGEDVLTIESAPEGVYLTARIRSADKRMVAEVVRNQFHINPNNYFRQERDEHSLIVYDQEGRIALSVRYLNPTAIKILGIFNAADRMPIVIEEDHQNFGSMIMSKSCLPFDPNLPEARINVR